MQIIVDEKLATTNFSWSPSDTTETYCALRSTPIKHDLDYQIINPDYDERYRDFWQSYLYITQRKGVTEQYAKLEMRRRHTLIGAMLIHKGYADGMICGTFGNPNLHLHYIDQVFGKRKGVNTYAAMNLIDFT